MDDYSKKITTHREFYPIEDINISIESDRGRILSSGAFRRLQKRTQVFALELNASIRTRLTHSLEVAQNARYIAKTILQNLSKEELKQSGLDTLKDAFISISEMTSLLHDIGNPPFGHFAEQTINSWVKNNFLPIFNKIEGSSELKKLLAADISNFDGNAQAIRIITKLQRLNLSYSQILAVVKYTRGAWEDKPGKEDKLNYLKKKPGFYFSEKEIIQKVRQTLNTALYCRYPITYIMEAADDISYLSADLEDAIEKRILTLDELYNLIKNECKKENEDYLLNLIEKRYKQAKESEEPYRFNMFFTLFRANLIGDLVRYVADIYLNNRNEIYNGSFNAALLEFEKNNRYYKAVKILQKISQEQIYKNRQVQELELQGFTIINSLLNFYKPLLELNSEQFSALLANKKISCFVSERLIGRISKKQITAYKDDIAKIKDYGNFELQERYFRARLLLDYISGMTDDYALYEYKTLLALQLI